MNDIGRIINDVNSSMAMEGMPLSPEDISRLKAYLLDPSKMNDILKELLEKHTVKVSTEVE